MNIDLQVAFSGWIIIIADGMVSLKSPQAVSIALGTIQEASDLVSMLSYTIHQAQELNKRK